MNVAARDYPMLPMRAIFLLALVTFFAVACTRTTDPLIDLIAADYGVSAGSASIVTRSMAWPTARYRCSTAR